MKVEFFSLDKIRPCPTNTKRHSQNQVEQIAASVEEFGWTKPILVDENFEILAGHGGRLAALHIGMKEVPCIVLSHLSERQKRAYRIADNKIAENSDWDWSMIGDEVSALLELDFDIDILGFDEQEIDAILRQAESFLPEKPAPPPPVPVRAHERQIGLPYKEPEPMRVDVVFGDLIEIGAHRLLCGDSTDSNQVERLMDGNKADMVFTDPPFNLPTQEFAHLIEMFKGVMQIWITNDLQCAELTLQNIDSFYTTFILRAGNSMLKNNRQPITTHCMMPCFYFHEAHKDLRGVETVIDAGRDLYMASKGVSHAKSVKTYEQFFNNWLIDGSIVVDLFMHSGSSMVAAHQLNRKCYGMEIEPKYCQVIINRMQKLDHSLSIKINGEKYNPNQEQELAF